MELKVLLRTMLRRWPVVLIVVALAVGGTYRVLDRMGPTYESVGSTLIYPPLDADGPGPTPASGNPYLELGGLTQARDIVIRSLTSKTVRTELEDIHPDMSFEATPDFTNSAPIILFTVEAATPEASTEALRDLMGRVPATLATLQEGQALSERARITSTALTEDLEPDVVRKDQIRAGILVAAGILGVGLLFIALLDGMLAARRRGRMNASRLISDVAAEPVSDPPPTPPEADSEPLSEAAEVASPDHNPEADSGREQAAEAGLVATASPAAEAPDLRSVGAAEERAPSEATTQNEFPVLVTYTNATREVEAGQQDVKSDALEDEVDDSSHAALAQDQADAAPEADVESDEEGEPEVNSETTRGTAQSIRLISVRHLARARDKRSSDPVSPRDRQKVRGKQ